MFYGLFIWNGKCLLAGDIDTGKAVLRGYINATIGFEELSKVFDKRNTPGS